MGLNNFFAVILIISLNIWWCKACLEQERNALLGLKALFVQPNNDYLSDWGKTEDCCGWGKVQCNAASKRVTQIDLFGVRGQELGDLYLNNSMFLPFEDLNSLDLSSNLIAGSVENEGFEILAALSNFEYLFLSNNNLDNSILASLNSLSSLKWLDLSMNRFEGTINFQGGGLRLSNLETLMLNFNNLNSSTLSFLTGFPSLTSLHIGYNLLRGSFNVKELCAFRNLVELELSGNPITNFVAPTEVKCMSNLSSIYLDDITAEGINILVQSLGSLPYLNVLSLRNYGSTSLTFGPDWSDLKNLEELDLSGNQNVTGSFIRTIATNTSLRILSLSNCGLNELLSSADWFCDLKNLQGLDISYNHLTGPLPRCLANFTSLENFNLIGNHLSDNISSSSPLSNLTSIQSLALGDNNFRIPISLVPFFGCSKLTDLFLWGTEFFVETETHNLIPKFQLWSISMRCDGCGGLLPRFLYYQKDLSNVRLSHIGMSGRFPNWLLQNNTKLESLDMAYNSFLGTFKLPTYRHMNLWGLDISSNHLQDQIPELFGEYFPRLKLLNMSNNGLNGNIPSSFGNLTLLGTLDLSNNRLSGGIPETMATGCISLRNLMLSNNSLQGRVFTENMKLVLLEVLQVGGNSFSGLIPNSLSNCSLLVEFDANNNHLSGEIPVWLGTINSLQILDLSRNNFTRGLQYCSIGTQLREVYLSKNILRGSLEEILNDCSELTTIDLSHNFLTGKIPGWIGVISQLNFLLLSHNKLEGELPFQLCLLGKLSLIDLSDNKLSGPLLPCIRASSTWHRQQQAKANPSDFGQTQSIAESPTTLPIAEAPIPQPQQPLEFTTKSTSYTYHGIILIYLSGIDLSSNKFTGEIPPEFGKLNEIKVLNLSHNSLIGSIPSSFSNLEQTESLDLSYNFLRGQIPPQLTKLHFLSAFSVAHNNLSGKIPDRVGQFATFHISSYEGNPFLCGPSLPKSCTTTGKAAVTVPIFSGDDEEEGSIDMGIFYVSFSASYGVVILGIIAVLSINPHWRRAWFHFVEVSMMTTYYFAVDNLPGLSKISSR